MRGKIRELPVVWVPHILSYFTTNITNHRDMRTKFASVESISFVARPLMLLPEGQSTSV